MDVCVESALLSSLIAWSSANRMAAMGEGLAYEGICPGNCFSFGIELRHRWLVGMSSSQCTENVQAYWWWFLWFEFHLALVPCEYESLRHAFTSRIMLTLCLKVFHLSRVKHKSEFTADLFSKRILLGHHPRINVTLHYRGTYLFFNTKMLVLSIWIWTPFNSMTVPKLLFVELKIGCFWLKCVLLSMFPFWKFIFWVQAFYFVDYVIVVVFSVNGSLIVDDVLPAEQHPTVITYFSRPL